ncbi:hypothetical protein BR93DRAFT_971218 [Coniochaeta sp. PMI_546]|nr:hypothetical protein BR93DRAFT_971218 [Coniochaeta sp. PMI_546]
MPSQQNSGAQSSAQAYFVMPNVDTASSSGTENWMVATVIDDNDLMFGGKSLSAWYEEDRRRQQSGSSKVEPERRGRSRERHGLGYDGPHHQKHRHHHGHKANDGKS